MIRAARRAREVAKATNTSIVVRVNGKRVELSGAQLDEPIPDHVLVADPQP